MRILAARFFSPASRIVRLAPQILRLSCIERANRSSTGSSCSDRTVSTSAKSLEDSTGAEDSAVPALKKALESSDTEVRLRAERALLPCGPVD